MMIKRFEVFFDDLSKTAKDRFVFEGFYHDNIDDAPIAVIEIEDDTDDKDDI